REQAVGHAAGAAFRGDGERTERVAQAQAADDRENRKPDRRRANVRDDVAALVRETQLGAQCLLLAGSGCARGWSAGPESGQRAPGSGPCVELHFADMHRAAAAVPERRLDVQRLPQLVQGAQADLAAAQPAVALED